MLRRVVFWAAAAVVVVAARASSPASDYDAAVRGKGVLLQLLVRGPGENATRAVWERLAVDFSDSSEVAVLRVFCDADEAFCADLLGGRHLGAFPSVFHGHPHAVREHLGGKTYEDLAAVARSVRAPCSPSRRGRCDAAQAALLDGCEAMGAGDLGEMIATTAISRTAAIDALEADLTDRRAELLAEWDALETVFLARVGRAGRDLALLYDVAGERARRPLGAADGPEDAESSYAADGLAGGYDDYYGDDEYADDEDYYYGDDELDRPRPMYDDEDDALYGDAYYADVEEEERRYSANARATGPRRR